MPAASEPAPGAKLKTWLSVAGGVVVLLGALVGVLYHLGDSRWVGAAAYAQDARVHDQKHDKIDARLMAVEKDVAIITTTLDEQRRAMDRQTSALDKVLQRLNQRESVPLAPAPRRRRRRP